VATAMTLTAERIVPKWDYRKWHSARAVTCLVFEIAVDD
jgi:hypothetical protein